jgi:uncharacterized protein
MQHTCVIYHKDCIDGTMSAGVVLRAFPHAETFPLRHSYTEEEFAPILASVRPDTHVYIVDCILGLDRLLSVGCTLTIIDHHKKACDEVANIGETHPQVRIVADPTHSGASLVWQTLFPNEGVPRLIEHVEDGDLWLEKYPDTKPITLYLSVFRDAPADMSAQIDVPLEVLLEKGQAISVFVDREAQGFLEYPPRMMRVGEYVVPAYNITTHESMCGNILSKKHDSTVIMYTVRGTMVRCSIRSHSHHSPNALEVASVLGGGGHPCSSGATISWERFLEIVG